MRKYDKLFITLDEEDMSRLEKGRLVIMDGIDGIPPIIVCTEKGYDNFLDFWGETDNES